MEPEYTSYNAEMCKILIETYNTSIIDHFDESLQASFIKEAKLCAERNHMRGNQRKVLAQLILNKEDQKTNPLPKVDYLGGPNTITYHWSNKYKKAIYIFGETHSVNLDCPIDPLNPDEKYEIENFLHDYFYFKNQIAFTDFYLEMPAYVVPDGYLKSGYSFLRIDRLRDYFKKCIGPERNEKPYCHSSRMHFFDIRQGKVKGGINSASLFQSDMLSLKNNLNNLNSRGLDKIEIVKIIRLFVDRWKSFFTFFKNLNVENEDNTLKYKKFWYDQIYNFAILKKEIDRMDENVRPLLNKFIQSELDILLTNGYKVASLQSSAILSDLFFLNENPSQLTDIHILGFQKSLYILLNEIVKFNVLISDAYLLARIFKKFNINNPLIKHRPTDEPEEPHNIIIYAGDMHSETYRKFLKYLGFRQLEQSPSPGDGHVKMTNCVNMSNITQPLFSKYPYGTKDDKPHLVLRKEFDSFNSVFKFDTETIFEQPVVPKDLLPGVSKPQEPDLSEKSLQLMSQPDRKRKNTYTYYDEKPTGKPKFTIVTRSQQGNKDLRL